MRNITIAILLLILGHTARGQVGIIPPEHIDSLINFTYVDTLYFFEKLKFAEKALSFANATDYQRGIFLGNKVVGICQLNLNRFDKSLKHFQDARLKAEELDSLGFKGSSEYYIGTIYNKMDNLEKALEHFENSLRFYEELGSPKQVGIVKNGIGVVYCKAGRLEKGLEIFKEALQIFKKNGLTKLTAMPIGNIGEQYYELKEYNIALRYYKESLELSRKFNRPRGEAIALANMGRSWMHLGQYQKAIESIEAGLAIAKEHQFNQEIYLLSKDLADTYELMGNTRISLEYYRKYAELKDSILNSEMQAEVAKLQVSYETERHQRELLEQEKAIEKLQKEREISRLMNVISLGGLGLFSILAYLFFSRQKARRKLMEEQLKNQVIEEKRLKKELDFKSQDLTNFALDISRKNEFAEKIHIDLQALTKSDPGLMRDKARKLLMTTSEHLKINEEFENFQMNIEKVNQDFFNKLNQRFPELTTNEKHLCGLIRLNLSTKEIASIKNISPKSVEMGRYRLRKKMNLDGKEDIGMFLQQL